MPDADGRFRGISVPALPWQREQETMGRLIEYRDELDDERWNDAERHLRAMSELERHARIDVGKDQRAGTD